MPQESASVMPRRDSWGRKDMTWHFIALACLNSCATLRNLKDRFVMKQTKLHQDLLNLDCNLSTQILEEQEKVSAQYRIMWLGRHCRNIAWKSLAEPEVLSSVPRLKMTALPSASD